MSLTTTQRTATIKEFKDNMHRLGLTTQQLAQTFNVNPHTIERIINLQSNRLEYPWIIRAYLINQAHQQGIELTPFTALRGDPHDYWFLDNTILDNNTITD